MKLKTRHKQCLDGLDFLGIATAREVAKYIFNEGCSDVCERNIAHPRLTELVKGGYVAVVGKGFDSETSRKVNLYQKVDGGVNMIIFKDSSDMRNHCQDCVYREIDLDYEPCKSCRVEMTALTKYTAAKDGEND